MFHKMKLNNIIKNIFFLTFFSGFLGPAFLSIKLSESFSLFPFRVMMLLFTSIFFLTLLINWHLHNLQKIRVPLFFLFLWLFYAMLTGMWVRSYHDYFRSILFLFFNVGFVLMSLVIKLNINDFKRLYNIWVFGLVISICIGLWNQITGNYLFEYESLDYIVNTIFPVPRSFYFNQNDYASFIVLSISFLFSMLINQTSKKMKIFLFFLTLLSIFHVVMTFSRTNFIAILFMFCLYFLLLSKKKLRAWAIVILITSVSIYTVYQFVPEKELEKIANQLSISLNDEDVSSNRRMNLIRNGFEYLVDSLGFGIGAGNTEYYMGKYKLYDTGGLVNMHNWLVLILVEYGVIIFVLYLFFLMFTIRKLYKIFNHSRKLKDEVNTKISLALLLSLISFILVNNSSSNYMNFIPQWLLFAFALAYVKYYKYCGKIHNQYPSTASYDTGNKAFDNRLNTSN